MNFYAFISTFIFTALVTKQATIGILLGEVKRISLLVLPR